MQPQLLVLAGLLFLFGLALALTIYFTTIDDRNARRALWQHDETQEALAGVGDQPTLREILQLNRVEMAAYHELTKVQARRSFANSLTAMWVGFMIVVGSIVLISVPDLVDSGTRLTVATIGTVGTILSGFVTRTFMKQHTRSIDQLNRFFDQPLVTSFLLGAERVARELDEPQRTAALEKIVARALDVGLMRSPTPSK